MTLPAAHPGVPENHRRDIIDACPTLMQKITTKSILTPTRVRNEEDLNSKKPTWLEDDVVEDGDRLQQQRMRYFLQPPLRSCYLQRF
jgi:hypothetical protein